MNLNCNNKFCKNKNCQNRVNSSYIKRLLKQIGPVILGSKPAEIVNISGDLLDKEFKIEQIRNFFDNCERIEYRVVNVLGDGKRVLFINRESMNRCLGNKKVKNFLKFMGYSKDYSFEEYIDELVSRLESEEFPHEIGAFLGYPLKDVLGFMGYSKKDLSMVFGWRVYGDVEPSYEVYNRFKRDKALMNEMVESMSIVELKEAI